MSREALYESLSAVMDDEADEMELHRVLAAGKDDAEFRAAWSRYQLARAAMHKELLEPRLDIAASVSAALAAEAAPKARFFSWGIVGRVAVAASVTVAVLAGVRLYNQGEMVGAEMAQRVPQSSLSVPQVQGMPVLAGYTEEAEQSQEPVAKEAGKESEWHEKRLPVYLRQHVQQSAVSGAESALPYARAASLENR
ncbi:RNA polymerase subunit sigma [Azotobacter chroococcum subsp. isscasi]|uniref:RseA family anti-sigma factor n=1 Tax=Azotobacter chroococcum TaxID=353 RepID=UPI00103EE6DF|nr:RseA family anti-sigma factor [Azotobacter chroococcum]TBW12089.1 RNA polymerase subunit sigma [Azotobacter chroococcum subsp. isscasi]